MNFLLSSKNLQVFSLEKRRCFLSGSPEIIAKTKPLFENPEDVLSSLADTEWNDIQQQEMIKKSFNKLNTNGLFIYGKNVLFEEGKIKIPLTKGEYKGYTIILSKGSEEETTTAVLFHGKEKMGVLPVFSGDAANTCVSRHEREKLQEKTGDFISNLNTFDWENPNDQKKIQNFFHGLSTGGLNVTRKDVSFKGDSIHIDIGNEFKSYFVKLERKEGGSVTISLFQKARPNIALKELGVLHEDNVKEAILELREAGKKKVEELRQEHSQRKVENLFVSFHPEEIDVTKLTDNKGIQKLYTDGVIFLQKGENDKAANKFERILRIESKNPILWLFLASAKNNINFVHKAISIDPQIVKNPSLYLAQYYGKTIESEIA